MAKEEIRGQIWLEGPLGDELTEREEARLLLRTDADGSFTGRFLSVHRFALPAGAKGGVWLCFVDEEERLQLREPQGSPGEVNIGSY
jgi:hypothetical protein